MGLFEGWMFRSKTPVLFTKNMDGVKHCFMLSFYALFYCFFLKFLIFSHHELPRNVFIFLISKIHFRIYKNEQNQTKCVAVLLALWKHEQANPKSLFCLEAQGVFLPKRRRGKFACGVLRCFYFPKKTLGMCGYTDFLGVSGRSIEVFASRDSLLRSRIKP